MAIKCETDYMTGEYVCYDDGTPDWEPGGYTSPPIESGPGGSYVEDERRSDYRTDQDTGEHVFDPTYGGTLPLPPTGSISPSSIPTGVWNALKSAGSGIYDFFKANPELLAGVLTGGGALLGSLDKAKPSGGGVGKAYAGPAQQLTRTIVQGKYGPIAQHSVQAARGGIMQAYAQGGAVPIRTGNQLMEDGGFVMTKRAVDGAGGPQGIRQVLPQAQLFQGPGDGSGRDDRIKTGIRAADGGITPALVSKNEMYVPRRDVQAAGGPRKVHAMMKSLERRA
jgi:hypothetical protein